MPKTNSQRTIGNEIRRVQDGVRRSVEETSSQNLNELEEEENLAEDFRSSQSYLNQVFQNELDDAVESSVSVDSGEVLEGVSSREDLEGIEQTAAVPMSFPYFVFLIAVVIDISDIGFAGIPFFMSFVNVFFSIFLFFWFRKKISKSFIDASENIASSTRRVRRYRTLARTSVGKKLIANFQKRFAEKMATRMLTKRLVLYAVTSMIWLLQIFVLQSLFVILAWKQQTKMVQGYMKFVESVSNILDRIDSLENKVFSSFVDSDS